MAPEPSASSGRIEAQTKAMPPTPTRDAGPSGSTRKDQPAPQKARADLQAGASAIESAVSPASPAGAAPQPRPPCSSSTLAKRAVSAEHSAAMEPTERSPVQWLTDIRKLKLEGKTAQAQASLAQFIKRYPQVPLPEDLQQP
ncbi:MAG: hypothetical protein EXR29_01990 [Betaproteobacteria bacterium]|nr:hypothetical protein [Betaproteobacteria bacterium]